MKHFTVIELGADSESPMVGTIDNVPNSPQGVASFKDRFQKAIGEHFDIQDEFLKYDELPDLFTGSPYEDVKVEVDGINYEVRILETWIY